MNPIHSQECQIHTRDSSLAVTAMITRLWFLPNAERKYHSTLSLTPLGTQTVPLAMCIRYVLSSNLKWTTIAAFGPVRRAHYRDLKTHCSYLHNSTD